MWRSLGLFLLWVMVAGSGFFTLCSGTLIFLGEPAFLLMALIGAGVTWGLVALARRIGAKRRAEDEAHRQDPNHGAQP